MNAPLKLLGIPGSLRRSSYNRAALVAAQEILPKGVILDMHPLNQPEVMIGNANKAFDGNGKLLDEDSRELLRQLLGHLCRWTRLLKGSQESSSSR